MNSIALKLDGLVIGYPDRPLSLPLDLELPAETTLGIIGGNGSGKTTLMKTLLGLTPPIGGSYHWREGSGFGYVPQENSIDDLFPLSVSDLLKMGGRKKKLKNEMREILSELEMEAWEHALFRELSGGQKQRVLLGRALMGRPNTLILDEPFNNLDAAFRKKLWDLLLHWQKKLSLTVILIEHDLNRIINHVEWMILLGAGQGFAGKTHDIVNPATLTAAYETPLHIHEEDGNLQVHFL